MIFIKQQMKELLMIVDPQVDFISGVLPVPGAERAMNNLVQYIIGNGSKYTQFIVTADRHPFNHCSFEMSGGQWPRHCVHDTAGAAVWQPLMEALYSYGDNVTFLYKGEDVGTEEYSIFKNNAAVRHICRIVDNNAIDSIDICGLAGDVCVANTLHDGIGMYGKSKFNVLSRFTSSLDGGKNLDSIISSLGISCDK